MGLTKIRIGNLITPIDERNCNGAFTDFYGININKEFMPSVANTDTVNPLNYKILCKKRFLFSGMQTGRDKCIRIGLYNSDKPIIVSPAYTTFEVTSEKVLPEYFFMLFKRSEMDRLGWFLSDSSVRSNLDWDRFCDIELDLPPLFIQQKYVDVYNAMLANQKAYEQGLEDLKLVCDAYIERLRHELPSVAIGQYLVPGDERNTGELDASAVRGLSTSKEIITTKANMDGVSVNNYKTFHPGQIAYVPDTSRRGDKISLALNSDDETYLVSSISTVFSTKEEKLLPAYLMMFFSRSEFDRYTRFHSWGSARETFTWEDMCTVRIPIPDIKVQQYIINIYTVYQLRREINEQLKAQIKELCPILIKGSLVEAEKL